MTCGTLAWGLDLGMQYFDTQTRNNIGTQSTIYEDPARPPQAVLPLFLGSLLCTVRTRRGVQSVCTSGTKQTVVLVLYWRHGVVSRAAVET